jgi:hypothetical protein
MAQWLLQKVQAKKTHRDGWLWVVTLCVASWVDVLRCRGGVPLAQGQ